MPISGIYGICSKEIIILYKKRSLARAGLFVGLFATYNSLEATFIYEGVAHWASRGKAVLSDDAFFFKKLERVEYFGFG